MLPSHYDAIASAVVLSIRRYRNGVLSFGWQL